MEVPMREHRHQNLRFSQAAAFLNLMRTIISLIAEAVKVWQSMR